MRPLGLSRALRLRNRRQFLRVQRGGTKRHTRHFLVFMSRRADEPQGPARLGITVTRKVGGAVQRNRIKRLVREAFRHERAAFPAGWDVVFVAKRDATALSFEQARREIRAAARWLQAPPAPGAAARGAR